MGKTISGCGWCLCGAYFIAEYEASSAYRDGANEKMIYNNCNIICPIGGSVSSRCNKL